MSLMLDFHANRVVDARATNQMMGSKMAFQDLDMEVYDIVHFDNDDLEAWIEGHGNIAYICKDGE
jgi:hypothetical protein